MPSLREGSQEAENVEKWDKTIFESCDRKYDKSVNGNHAGTAAQNVSNQQVCGELAVGTHNASLWVYNQDDRNCQFKTSYTDDSEYGSRGYVLGSVGCGLMSQEHWRLLMNCTLAYGVGSKGRTIKHQTVENLCMNRGEARQRRCCVFFSWAVRQGVVECVVSQEHELLRSRIVVKVIISGSAVSASFFER